MKFLITLNANVNLKYRNVLLLISLEIRAKLAAGDTAAILNLSDLRSIMGYPGGTPSVFTLAFRAKLRELYSIFLGKRAIIIASKHGTTIFFPIAIFF